ncbi:hypothetical protein SBC1_70840 (plasmid) [Caballeronia sp. SBC1]|nr:hypothetical protein SBC2_70580 [Caballeronia sp. SBC2]QIN67037.1 hypothetical protein SBC1_70840 [Caballeronia sp. SBC1]
MRIDISESDWLRTSATRIRFRRLLRHGHCPVMVRPGPAENFRNLLETADRIGLEQIFQIQLAARASALSRRAR